MELLKQVANPANPTEVKLQISKSIGSLIIATSKLFTELVNETIQIEIERANGSNFEITKGAVSLQRFLLATTYGEDCLTSNIEKGLKTIALSEICVDGSIHLFEKDVLKITLKNLAVGHSYIINGIEEPETSVMVHSFESKSMASDDTNKDFNVQGYDMVVIDKSDDIDEISYTFENGQVVKYSQFELETLAESLDPVSYINQGLVESGYVSFLQLPLLAVSNINIRKTQGTVINLLLRNHI